MSEAMCEAETIINFNEEEAIASIYTASRRVASLLQRRGLKPVRVERLRDGEPDGWWFEIPKWQVLVKPANRTIRIGGGKKSGLSLTSRINSIPEIDAQSEEFEEIKSR